MMVAAAFVPFYGYLLSHFFCQIFHFVLISIFHVNEVPEFKLADAKVGDINFCVMHGLCPYEVGVTMNSQQAYCRLTWPLSPRDQFRPVGIKSLFLRVNGTVRVVGVIKGNASIGMFEFQMIGGGIIKG